MLLELSEKPTRTQLTRFHKSIEALAPDEIAILRMPKVVTELHPLIFGSVLQAIMTWGQMTSHTVLEIPWSHAELGGLLDAIQDSEYFVTAVILAEAVRTSDGIDVSENAQECATSALAQRNSFSDLAPGSHGAVILPTHLPRLASSPDLHAMTAGRQAIEEEARTLYHDIWPDGEQPDGLRKPWRAQGEVGVPPEDPTHITRIAWPSSHPLSPSDKAFQPVIRRRLSPNPDSMLHAHDSSVSGRDVSDQLGEVLFELVQNTEWHTLTQRGGLSGRGCRIVRVDAVNFSTLKLPDLEQDERHLSGYLGNLLHDASSDSVRLGVVSVIDSGIGLARSAARALGNDAVDDKNEVQFLMKALEKSIRVSHRSLGKHRTASRPTDLDERTRIHGDSHRKSRDPTRLRREPIRAS